MLSLFGISHYSTLFMASSYIWDLKNITLIKVYWNYLCYLLFFKKAKFAFRYKILYKSKRKILILRFYWFPKSKTWYYLKRAWCRVYGYIKFAIVDTNNPVIEICNIQMYLSSHLKQMQFNFHFLHSWHKVNYFLFEIIHAVHISRKILALKVFLCSTLLYGSKSLKYGS